MSTHQKSVNRRSFLKKSALAGGTAASAALAAPAVLAQSPIVMRMQTSWGGANIWNDFAQSYADRVNAMSGGRLQVEILPAGAVVAAFQVMDAVSDGVLDAAHSVSAYWYGKSKAASLFGTGPAFGNTALGTLGWFYEGGGEELYRELTQDQLGLNVVGLLGFPMPAQPFGWFKNEISGVGDLDGFRYRTVGLAADLLDRLGMSVAQLPGGEIVPAMERGVIDAFEFNNPSSDRDFGAQDVAKNYYLRSFHQTAETFEFLFNKDFYDDLDPDLQAILRYGVEASVTADVAASLRRYSEDLQRLINEDGVTIHLTPGEILEAQMAAWAELIPELETDPISKRILDSQRAWAENVAFYEIANAPDLSFAYERFFPGRLPG